MKKISTLLLCSSTLLVSSAFATTYDVSSVSSTGYDLPYNQQQTLTGGFFHRFKSKTIECKVRADKDEVKLDFTSLNNRLFVNGVILDQATPSSHSLIVKPNEKFKVKFERNAKLGVTNTTENSTVNIDCK